MGVAAKCLTLLLLVQLAHVAQAQAYSNDDNWAYYDMDYFIDYEQADDGTPLHNYTSGEVFSWINCTSTLDCIQQVHGFSICVDVVGDYVKQCACDIDAGYTQVGPNCTFGASLGDLCITDESACYEDNSACMEDGTNTGQRRCLCVDGYVMVGNGTNSYVCASLLHERLDPNCATCEENEGKCYDANGDGMTDGCVCPASRTGTDCADVNVEVICDLAAFKMYVCYIPHPSLNFYLGAVFHVDGLLQDPACRGWLVTADNVVVDQCKVNEYQLELPLETKARERCGTTEINPAPDTVKYENKLVAHNDPNQITLDDIVFKTYCSFQQFSDGSFQALGVMSINRNDRGSHKAPTISMDVENLLGKKIPSGVSLRLGDKIRLRIKLENDGTYTAMRVLRCTASTKPTVPDPKAITVPLVINSCPYPRQNIINYKNTWYRVSPHELQTGALRVFKMSQGDSVHLHCAIKLCLSGSESECDPVQCRTPHSFPGMGRRKRDVDSDMDLEYFDPESPVHSARQMDVMVSRVLNIIDPDATDVEVGGKVAAHPPYLIIVLGIVVVLVFLLVIVAIVMFRRLTSRLLNNPDDDLISTLTSDTMDSPSSDGYTMILPKDMADISHSSSGFGSPGGGSDFDHSSCGNLVVRQTPATKLMTSC